MCVCVCVSTATTVILNLLIVNTGGHHGGLLFIVQFCINNIFVIFFGINVLKLKLIIKYKHFPFQNSIHITIESYFI